MRRDRPLPASFAFIDGALDRADALRDDSEALARLWPQARVVLLEDDGRALAGQQDALLDIDGATLGGGPGTAIFLGVDTDGRAWFAQRAATASPAACAGATQRVDLRRAAAAWPATEATAFAQARAVLHWHARHRHCGDCGAEPTTVIDYSGGTAEVVRRGMGDPSRFE